MSNEADLDWLARNVHVWPEGKNFICYSRNHGYAIFHEHDKNCARWFTKDQWLALRAELQNKPSWADAPEWAEWLAKDSPDKGGESAWWWYADKPVDMKNTWQVSTEGRARMASSCHCDLGDWRGTLEKRPYFSATNCKVTSSGSFRGVVGEASELSEQAMTLSQQEAPEFKPSIEEVNRLAQEFKLFTSIEDNQQQEMKQDNGWFERGELPPVGARCVALLGIAPKANCEVIAKTEQQMVVRWEENGMMDVIDLDVHAAFRPISTERDELIGIITSNLSGTTGKVADAIIAAGFKLEAK